MGSRVVGGSQAMGLLWGAPGLVSWRLLVRWRLLLRQLRLQRVCQESQFAQGQLVVLQVLLVCTPRDCGQWNERSLRRPCSGPHPWKRRSPARWIFRWIFGARSSKSLLTAAWPEVAVLGEAALVVLVAVVM